MAKTTICRNCGRGLEPSQNFCGGCGASIMADTNPTDPYIGRLIDGKYLIEQLVGTGAMGVVYRAKQVSLNKKVAVKILRRSLLGDATVTLRFKQEARAASRLNHPNTIQVLDFGELPEIGLYMAMEFVEGRDLGKFIQSDLPIAHRRLVHIIKQTLSALDEAHGVGIIHRDVKPANILVCNLRLQPDFVKVLDFGIAKILDPDPSESIPMTREGFVCGTPAFMSPEQVQGMPLDARTDLFSLGIVLYQCLTGKLPFEADSAVEMATKIVLENPPPPRSVRPEWEIPPLVEAVTLKAMQKQRERRFQNAGEMLDALERAGAALEAHGEFVPTGAEPKLAPLSTAPVAVAPLKAPAIVSVPPGGAPQAAEPAAPCRAVVSLPSNLKGAPAAAAPRPAGFTAAAAPPAAATVPTTAAGPSLSARDRAAVTQPAIAAVQDWPGGGTQELIDRALRPRYWRGLLFFGLLLVLGAASIGIGHLAGGWIASLAPSAISPSLAIIDTGTLPAGAPTHTLPADGSIGSSGSGSGSSAADLGQDQVRLAGPAGRLQPARPEKPAGGAPATRSERSGGGDTGSRATGGSPPPSREPSRENRAGELHGEGMRLMRQTDWSGALHKLEEARALAPEMAVLHRDMGRICMRLGRKGEALGHFQSYLRLAPSAVDAATYRTIIEDLGQR